MTIADAAKIIDNVVTPSTASSANATAASITSSNIILVSPPCIKK